ncbi:hypothetical protein [Nocardia colli]|uniref:hypothetical protein n=1 Tax=Nocardia colli TaxID=2545717 RepID=UPI0035D82DE9
MSRRELDAPSATARDRPASIVRTTIGRCGRFRSVGGWPVRGRPPPAQNARSAAIACVCYDGRASFLQGDYWAKMLAMPAAENIPTVNIRLWRADAIVLYDWLRSTDMITVPITHPAQKQALVDLFARFEWAADYDVMGCSSEEVVAAQEEVARDMGW